ncbi:MAG: SUMF1/EgtB/PvdO family nonheme iron enzyme [Chloroflexi bacterium]|nr:SUMF1/EgtB/PvdO family nonheme iron enzyme [Chloroflexota bacterium]
MSKTNTPPTDEQVVPFMSFTSFRDTHRDLLKRRREEKKEMGAESADFWTAVNDFLRRGEAAGAFLDEDEDRTAAQNLLDYWDTQLFHTGIEAPEAILAEFNPLLQPEIHDDHCPYIGLNAFDDSNQHLFYGRNDLINDLLNQALVSRLVTTIGPSGSGKSSVVLAGLLPRLKKGELPGSAIWNYYPTIVPGSDPLTSLARLMQPDDPDTTAWIPKNKEILLTNPNHLTELIESRSDKPAVLVIDQFEETFTLCHSEAERDAFLDNILNLVRTRNIRHVVILTMRVDYESYLTKAPLFHSLVEQGQVRIAAMNGAELHDAIEQPATAVGLKFEEGLVDELVRQIIGEPAALPLLQFALLQLWDNRERNRVTWETYRRLGSVMEILANTANNIYTSLLPEERVTARRILLHLVKPGEGLEFTRRRVPRRLLYQTGEAHDRIDRVLEKLIQSRLVRSSKGRTEEDDQIEVAHEALVRNWPRLVEWLEEERFRLRHRLRLTDQAEQWDSLDRDESALLRGALLDEARRYEDLNPLEEDFVQASQDAMRRQEKEREAARRRELEQARALAAEQSRLARAETQRAEEQRQLAIARAESAQRARHFNIALIIILALVLIAAVIMVNLVQTAANATTAQAEAEQSNTLATQSALDAQVVELTAIAVARQSTQEAEQVLVAQATITSEFATQQAIAADRQIEQNKTNATAAAATATADYQTAADTAATATQSARTTPPAEENTTTQATPSPDPQTLSLDAQLKAFVREEDNMPMLYMTGGVYEMGATGEQSNIDEQPPHEITIPDFYMDKFEVSVQQYSDFLNRMGQNRDACFDEDCAKTLVDTQFTHLLNNFGVFEPRPGTSNFPVNWITWPGAKAYCESVGARLPTEAEWEYAAKGYDGRLYPWGNEEPIPDINAIFGIRQTQFNTAFKSVDALPDGISPFGLFGMAGSVWEWTEDWYDPTFYNEGRSDQSANSEDTTGEKVMRGGSWTDNASELRTANRGHLPPIIDDPNDLLYIGVGFRCARDMN